MDKANKNNNKGYLSNFHKDKLGLQIPDGYFSKSKLNILDAIHKEEERKQTLFWLNPKFSYPIAASIILLISITFWWQNNTPETNLEITDVEKIEVFNMDFSSDQFLVSSLFVEDSEMDQFVDAFLMKEIIVEVDNSEQKLENIFINSLFIDDSLIDNYTQNSILENMIL
ncbi:MAG: hypothetical protein L3J25_05045 [Flavobacteriaceae bacterium]|nr:hypothetical protein [Flavobacteriaceae bacterium]